MCASNAPAISLNHRQVWVGRDLWRSYGPTFCWNRAWDEATWSFSSRGVTVASEAHFINLFQHWMVFKVKNLPPISRWIFPGGTCASSHVTIHLCDSTSISTITTFGRLWLTLQCWAEQTQSIPSLFMCHIQAGRLLLQGKYTCTSYATKIHFFSGRGRILSRTEMGRASEILVDFWCTKFSLYLQNLVGSTTWECGYEVQLIQELIQFWRLRGNQGMDGLREAGGWESRENFSMEGAASYSWSGSNVTWLWGFIRFWEIFLFHIRTKLRSEPWLNQNFFV